MASRPEVGRDIGSPTRWVERWWAGAAGWRGQLLSLALAPAEAGFRGVVRLRGAAYDHGLLSTTRVAVPVISVGNISVGGAGKTPVARWLVAELRRLGHAPAVLHGGYALDEPALHRLWHPELPVVVGRDRIVSARRAIEGGATVLVLDDGFQHRRLGRDLDLVLVAAESWPARRRLLPRGPWREAARALARAQAVAVTRKVATAQKASAVLEELRSYAPRAAVLQLQLRPSGWLHLGANQPAAGACAPAASDPRAPGPSAAEPAVQGPDGEVLAVTAIARPELFVGNAREAGAEITGSLFFPDHHDFTTRDVAAIRRAAAGRPLIATAKDLVKLGPLAPDLDLWILEQEVVVEAGGARLNELLAELGSGPARKES